MDKRKKQGQNIQKDRFVMQGKSRGSDSLNWREEPSSISADNPIISNSDLPPAHVSQPPYQTSTSPDHEYHQSHHYQRFVDQDHMEMVRFLNNRWLEVKNSKETDGIGGLDVVLPPISRQAVINDH